ncbi:transporter substrate-binding domain-containing protein [Vibrio sp. ZSDZ65]|uniref:Transporter substrate-binding domain-containing protein n=1 Tax=Vibrio qingdaonensis TaxID=2829491 RepID=A0A9X3CQI8_9VIBR|nr:transporter substrate-binding domain-containing protein [Vibrio qingdaonensis]
MGDFDSMQKKGVIRILVSADLGFYHMENGRPKGITAEHIQHFERAIKKSHPLLRVIVVPVKRSDIIDNIEQGLGDIAIANLTITEKRLRKVDFSQPIRRNVTEYLVTHPSMPALTKIEQLAGKQVWVKAGSSHLDSVQNVNQMLKRGGRKPITIRIIDDNLQDLDLLTLLESSAITATIVDNHKLKLWTQLSSQIQIHDSIALRNKGEVAWAMRKDSPLLSKTINSYLASSKQGTLLGNVIDNRYLKKTNWMNRASNPIKNQERAKLEILFGQYGDKYDIDWMILLAQAFQESALDHSKVSHRGAVGIMQVMPKTALDWYVDINNVNDLESNIHAGAKYLRFIHDRYFDKPEISKEDKVYFSLAAYNAGPAKIRRMRALAKKQGYNPNKWFNNVEIVAKANISKEPVNYVANIKRYFTIYKRLDAFQDAREDQYLGSTIALDIKALSPYFAY